MGNFSRILAVLTVLWAGGLSAAAFEGPSKDGDSKAKPGAEQPAAGVEKASPATVQAYEAGIKAYQEGKTDLAIRALGKALQGGGLESPKIAQALYYRGMSYRKKGQPGLAIADLTSAIWLKDGLNYADQQEAMSARVAAYREAGISDVPQLPSADVALASSGAQQSAGWQTAMDNSPTAASTTMGTIDPQFPQHPSAPAPQQQSSSSSGGGISGFFNSVTNGVTSLFGGGSSSTPNADDGAVTTASLSSANNTASTSEASWSGNTEVATASPSHNHVSNGFVTEVATASPEQTTSVAPSGKYRLQIAAVRSRVEADNVAHRVITEYGGDLGPRAPVVDEAVIGSMGTFYRVRVGPYANADEPQKLCGKLQASGFDCLVVTQ